MFFNLTLNVPIFCLLSVGKKLFLEYSQAMCMQKASEDGVFFWQQSHPGVDVNS
jgi:hypothetical protein